MSDTIEQRAEELIGNFDLFEDKIERYEYLMDLGRKLPPMDEAEKTEDARVHGCQSQVWVTAHIRPPAILDISADSDAAITKGVVYVLWYIFSGQPADKILAFDVDNFLQRLQLDQMLSMNRRNGLAGMVQRIKTLAASHAPEAKAA